jgi:hypothetical protein
MFGAADHGFAYVDGDHADAAFCHRYCFPADAAAYVEDAVAVSEVAVEKTLLHLEQHVVRMLVLREDLR